MYRRKGKQQEMRNKKRAGFYGMQQKQFYVNTILLPGTEKHQIDNLTLHLRQMEKEEQKNPKISTRKEITKI